MDLHEPENEAFVPKETIVAAATISNAMEFLQRMPKGRIPRVTLPVLYLELLFGEAAERG